MAIARGSCKQCIHVPEGELIGPLREWDQAAGEHYPECCVAEAAEGYETGEEGPQRFEVRSGHEIENFREEYNNRFLTHFPLPRFRLNGEAALSAAEDEIKLVAWHHSRRSVIAHSHVAYAGDVTWEQRVSEALSQQSLEAAIGISCGDLGVARVAERLRPLLREELNLPYEVAERCGSRNGQTISREGSPRIAPAVGWLG